MNISRHSATGIVVALEGTTVVAITPLPAAEVYQRFNPGPSWYSPALHDQARGELAEQLELAYQAAGTSDAVAYGPDPVQQDAELVKAARELGIDLTRHAEARASRMTYTPGVDGLADVAESWRNLPRERTPELELGVPVQAEVLPADWRAKVTQGVERITCADVEVGDLIGQRRMGPFHRVTQVRAGERSAWLYLEGTSRIRPQHATKLWRQVSA